MLGILLCEGEVLLRAYSGVVNGLSDPEHYFVPPIYDLANPDDFYLQEDEEISALNAEIEQIQHGKTKDEVAKADPRLSELKQRRKELSLQLQLKIFSRFNLCNRHGIYRNVVDIFRDAKRGLPPGGTGECAAPRLLHYAFSHGLTPIAMAEFWYGQSPRNYKRVHGQFYPSCIEKCSPLLSYMVPTEVPESPVSEGTPTIIWEDEHLIVLHKPSGLLSAPAKDLSLPNVETWLHDLHPEVRGPMLAHRLDQATSGLMLAAKDAATHKLLQQGFESRQIHKRYVALLEGHLQSQTGLISLPICPNPDDRPRQVVDWQFGKPALTRYRVLQYCGGNTLVEFRPLTGRTHQLRLHAASPFGLDHPIVGDELYGAAKADRLHLHAAAICLPDGRNWQASYYFLGT